MKLAKMLLTLLTVVGLSAATPARADGWHQTYAQWENTYANSAGGGTVSFVVSVPNDNHSVGGYIWGTAAAVADGSATGAGSGTLQTSWEWTGSAAPGDWHVTGIGDYSVVASASLNGAFAGATAGTTDLSVYFAAGAPTAANEPNEGFTGQHVMTVANNNGATVMSAAYPEVAVQAEATGPGAGKEGNASADAISYITYEVNLGVGGNP